MVRGLTSSALVGVTAMRFLELLRDRTGATAIEYALIAALISIACIIAFNSLGLNLADVFNTIADAIMRR